MEQLPDQSKRDGIGAEIERAQANCVERLSQSAILGGLNPTVEEDAGKIIELLKDRKDTGEFWCLNELNVLAVTRQAIEQGVPTVVAWATACAERCRMMRIYKESLEEVIWMGNSASRLLTFLQLWNEHKTNDDEEFWQIKLTGCNAGLFREAVHGVYIPRIQRGNAYFAAKVLGARGHCSLLCFISSKTRPSSYWGPQTFFWLRYALAPFAYVCDICGPALSQSPR